MSDFNSDYLNPEREWNNFLHRVSIFSELEEKSIEEVAKKLKPLSLPKGAILYREGDPGDAMYIIQSGRVRVIVQDNFGKEKVLNYLGRGDILGETTLLTGMHRSTTAKVDSDTSFLVLYKKDFEDFLKANPAASFYLSRLLSHRLHIASHPSLNRKFETDLVGIFCELPKEDHIVFVSNLCRSLVEQNRSKILLLELTPYGNELVQSFGMNPVLTSSRMLKADDLQNKTVLEKMTLISSFGLEVITLSEEVFSGNLFRSISAFMTMLRRNYDIVLIDVINFKENSSSQDQGNEIARAFLEECNLIFHVCSGKINPSKFLNSISGENEIIKKILLGQRNEADILEPDFVIPWDSSSASNFQKGKGPLFDVSENKSARKMLDRIARFIGKIQVGIAMGSGAAYGYTMIGIMKVFEREKIPIDIISGTSMGALLGSFFAMGKTAEEVEKIAYTISKAWIRRRFLRDLNLPWPHGGLLIGETISQFLRDILGEREFKSLETPFACTATDIITGDAVVFRRGKVWKAVRASTSLPIIFAPYRMGNRFLVDGGLVNPVPTSLIASMGADLMISVNLTNKASEKKVFRKWLGMFPVKSPGMANILFKMIYTMQYQISSARTDLAHIAIHPDTRNFSWVDFHKAKQIIPLGEEAAEECLTKVKSRLPYFTDYCKVTPRQSY